MNFVTEQTDNHGPEPEDISYNAPGSEASSPPLLVTVHQACRMLNCGKTTVFALINQGTLERRKIGKATRITLDSIKKLAGV